MKRIFILSLVFVLLLALIGSGTVGSFNDTETSADNQLVFQWEQECPRGKFNVANDDIVQGSFDDKVFMYDEYGSLLENNIIDLDDLNAQPSGIASTEDYLYVLDQGDKKVYRYSYCGELLGVSGTLKDGNGGGLGNPSGLTIAGDVMWIVLFGPNNPLLYKYSLSTAFSSSGNIWSTDDIGILPGNYKATGLAMDSNYLYVVDRRNHRIYRYPHNGGFPNISLILKGENGSNLNSPSGVMCDGSSLWVVDKGKGSIPGKIYQYPLTSLFYGYGTLQSTLTTSDEIRLDTEEAIAETFAEYYWHTVNAIEEYPLDGQNNNPTGM